MAPHSLPLPLSPVARDFASMPDISTPSTAQTHQEQVQMHILTDGGDIERRAGLDPADSSQTRSFWFRIRGRAGQNLARTSQNTSFWCKVRGQIFWIWPLLFLAFVVLGVLGGVAYINNKPSILE